MDLQPNKESLVFASVFSRAARVEPEMPRRKKRVNKHNKVLARAEERGRFPNGRAQVFVRK